MPDDMFGNITQYNTAHNFCEIMKLAGDIGGGLAVNMPSEKELENPESSCSRRETDAYDQGAIELGCWPAWSWDLAGIRVHRSSKAHPARNLLFDINGFDI